jgi:hypothetical protein
MILADAIALIRPQMQRLDALYGRPLFDEWAVLALDAQGVATVAAYVGPREKAFASELGADTRALREAAARRECEPGDFEFVLDAAGAHLDAFIRLGPAVYLVCNHTAGTMDEVRRDPAWKKAQPAWFTLAERFRADPVA